MLECNSGTVQRLIVDYKRWSRYDRKNKKNDYFEKHKMFFKLLKENSWREVTQSFTFPNVVIVRIQNDFETIQQKEVQRKKKRIFITQSFWDVRIELFWSKQLLRQKWYKLKLFFDPYKEEYFAALNYGMKRQFKEIIYLMSLA